MSNRLEIILSQANNKPVKLTSMSSDALNSFIAVMTALQVMAEHTVVKEELSFSIEEGSAMCAVEAPEKLMDSIYDEMNLAINGESEDKEFTKQLRIIQEQIKNESLGYQFKYKKNNSVIDIDGILRNSSRISVKRKRDIPYVYKLKIVNGYLNQIGGQNPNYHFDYGQKDSITIDCSKDDALEITNYLYKNVNALLLCKEWKLKDKKNEYYHKTILDDSIVPLFKDFIKSYYSQDNMVEKLTVLHDFVDNRFQKSSDEGFKFLEKLLIAFNDKNYHLSEIKTLLVISKPFQDKNGFKDIRKELLETYQNRRD